MLYEVITRSSLLWEIQVRSHVKPGLAFEAICVLRNPIPKGRLPIHMLNRAGAYARVFPETGRLNYGTFKFQSCVNNN